MYRLLPLLLLMLPFSDISGQNEIPLDSTSHYIGKYVKVCAKVAGTFVTNSASKVTLLNLGEDFPKTKFTVVIYEKDLPNFEFVPSEYYKNKSICVIGTINEYKSKPQINARFSNQIEVKE
ncbi:MAG TPA: hypothetical protein VK169_07545 [Saprospiraceae bacterium]|nr:hypothetical protein [Saprospiraceae bacterium]